MCIKQKIKGQMLQPKFHSEVKRAENYSLMYPFTTVTGSGYTIHG